MPNFKILIGLILILLVITPVYAEELLPQDGVPVEGEVTEPVASPETPDSPQEEGQQESELPEGLEMDQSGNVEESESVYTLTLNLPQELIGSELSIQDPFGTNLKRMKVNSTGQVSYSFVTPQSLNVTVQGPIKGEEETDEGLIPISTAVVAGIFGFMIVALLAFLGGRISALHVLSDLRDYIYDKNLD